MDEIVKLVSKGKSLLEDGKFDDALGFFEQALLLNQDDPGNPDSPQGLVCNTCLTCVRGKIPK